MEHKEKADIVTETLEQVDKTARRVVSETDRFVEPYRRSALQRFPILFMFLGAFGATATFLGMEQLIMDNEWLADHPSLILLIGIAALVLTGTLYKKLR